MTNKSNERSFFAGDALTLFKKTALSLSVAAAMAPVSVLAQEDTGSEVEEVVVTGIRQTLRNSIDIKRDSTTIVDALSSDEIGELPDNSVAETLERVTGVTGDRFKGNASEISIRGMGPFLGSSTINGRRISSGSGSRAVAFTQFPSELVNGVVVYKAQQADIREGGVSGTVDLQTIKPLDYGKRRITMDIRGQYNPLDDDIAGSTGWGQRGSISFVDVFETDIGDFGFALGYAGGDTPVSERSFNTSGTFRDCDSDRAPRAAGNTPSPGSINNCDSRSSFDGDGGFDPATNESIFYDDSEGFDDGYYFATNQLYWRTMESEEERDAWIGALQWQPNEKWDINLDMQSSDREYYEDRRDFYIDESRRGISDVVATEEGALLSFDGISRVATYNEYRVRSEKYTGSGLNLKFSPTDAITLELDAATSQTVRRQSVQQARLRSGGGNNGNARFTYNLDYRGSDNLPVVTLGDVITTSGDSEGLPAELLDPNNLATYSRDMRARLEYFQIRDDIDSFGLNGRIELDSFISAVKVGVDWSEHRFLDYDRDRREVSSNRSPTNARYIDPTDLTFCQRDFQDNGFASEGTGVTSWAQLDPRCATTFIVSRLSPGLTSNPFTPSSADIDLTETVTSLYGMAEFGTDLGNIEVSGNFGIRFVNTEIESDWTRGNYVTTDDGNGDYFWVVEDQSSGVEVSTTTNDFNNILPSLNLTFTFSEELQVRFAAYQALSRPDMWYLGRGRTLDEGDAEDFAEGLFDDGDPAGVSEAIAFATSQGVSTLGNPELEALESTNLDLSASYFFNDDTALSVALYAKEFEASYGAEEITETYTINGAAEQFTIGGNPIIEDESETINGFELSFQSVFTSLPAPFDGLGTVLSYNFSDSSFETDENGLEINDEIIPSIEPANLLGLSENVFSGQLFWENDVVTARLAYKYRSEYLKPFDNDLQQTNRYVDDLGTWDFDISYEVVDNLRLRFQAINFTDEPYVEQRVVRESFNRIEYGSARYFVGVKYSIF